MNYKIQIAGKLQIGVNTFINDNRMEYGFDDMWNMLTEEQQDIVEQYIEDHWSEWESDTFDEARYE